MKRPAIFFDRDNTLIVANGYLGDPSKVVLVDGAADAIARARQLGFAIVVISNQSGVARGMFSEDDVRAVNARLDAVLKNENPDAIVDRHEFCPYHPQAAVEAYRRESDLRKPSPGMIYAAAQLLALDLTRSWVIGDAPRDIESGQAAGCRTILFQDPTIPKSPAAAERAKVPPEKSVTTLAAAIDYIASDPAKPISKAAPMASESTAEMDQASSSTTALPRTSDAQRSTNTPIDIKPESGIERMNKLESVAEQILSELRRQHELSHSEFSVSKLLAGIAQVVAIAVVFLSYLNRKDVESATTLLFAVWLQCLTIALLIMGRSR